MNGRFGFLLLACALTGCGQKPADKPVDKVTDVDSDDPKMNAAIAKARQTVNTFITSLKSPKPGQGLFSVKTGITENGYTEHMWLGNVSFDGTKFHGTIDNIPDRIKNVKIGQRVSVTPAEISDWMFIQDKKLVGGETLRVLRDGMPPQERAEFEKTLPFKIE